MRHTLCYCWFLLLGSVLFARADFALRDGDTVVFLGDSITAARNYSKIIEVYTLLRFPERKVRFINAGQGGETARGSLERFQTAVLDSGATVVTAAYGVNDIGWGARADDAHKQEYLAAIAELVRRCRERGIRLFLCSAAITAEPPERAETGFLQKMCDEGLALAKAQGAGTIDVQRGMRAVQRRVLSANEKQADPAKRVRMHADDGIHLNDLGQMAMAFAILKGLGAPAEVSSAALDVANSQVLSAVNCDISRLHCSPDYVSFTRLDRSLPLNLAPLWMLNAFYMPIGDELNRYTLRVAGLAPGTYEIRAANRALGRWTAADLASTVNLASATADPWEPGGPWDAQGHLVKMLTDSRDEIVAVERGVDRWLQAHPQQSQLRAVTAALETNLVEIQRQFARPVPVDFQIHRVAAQEHRP